MEKQELIALASELLNVEDLDARAEDLQLLRREYKALSLRDEDSFFEQQQTNKFLALFEQLAQKQPKLLTSPYDEKKRIIEAAKKLLERKDILAANKELDRLSEDFRKAGRSGSKEQDDELWNEFRAVKDEFYAKKKAYFEELDKSNAEKRAKKEEVIEEAKAALEIDDIKEASARIDALRKKWKEIGYSGKGDDGLWKEFAAVLDEFREKKKQRHAEMQQIFEQRAEQKEALIKKARTYLANSEFTDEEIEAVKALRIEYRAIGFAGKEKDDELYGRFNEILQKYFEEMKFYK